MELAGRWYTALGLNVLLGIPGVIPIWMLWYIAANWPLAGLGVTEREPTENDGLGVGLVVFGPVVATGALLWWLANRPLARRTRLAPHHYWLLSILGTLVPTATLMVISI
ncbi:hypothetical protein ACFYYI_06385 [Streptomyces sp. NPDC002387]|uniref:hypothetical protein n=1 Tax=Streptomyces sp. NPDC002387 TaxID=3364643 RepID=UPI0036ACFDE0